MTDSSSLPMKARMPSTMHEPLVPKCLECGWRPDTKNSKRSLDKLRQAVEKHLKRNHQNREYKCPVCPHSFKNRPDNVKSHIMRKHPERFNQLYPGQDLPPSFRKKPSRYNAVLINPEPPEKPNEHFQGLILGTAQEPTEKDPCQDSPTAPSFEHFDHSAPSSYGSLPSSTDSAYHSMEYGDDITMETKAPTRGTSEAPRPYIYHDNGECSRSLKCCLAES